MLSELWRQRGRLVKGGFLRKRNASQLDTRNSRRRRRDLPRWRLEPCLAVRVPIRQRILRRPQLNKRAGVRNAETQGTCRRSIAGLICGQSHRSRARRGLRCLQELPVLESASRFFFEGSADRHASGIAARRPEIQRWRRWPPQRVRASAFDLGKVGASAEFPKAPPLSPLPQYSRHPARNFASGHTRPASCLRLRMRSTAAPESASTKPRPVPGMPEAEQLSRKGRTLVRDASRGLLLRVARRLPGRSTRSKSGEPVFAGLRPHSDAKAPDFRARISSTSPGSPPTAEWRAFCPLSIRRPNSGKRFSGAERNTADM